MHHMYSYVQPDIIHSATNVCVSSTYISCRVDDIWLYVACSISDVNINTTHIAYPSIQAGVWAAVINVDITVCPYPPHSTVTLVPIHHILKQICTHCPSDCL